MSIDIVPYNEVFLWDFHYKGMEKKFILSDEQVRGLITQCTEREGRTMVGLLDGGVVFFAGITLLGPRVGEGWAFVNPPPKNKRIATYRALYRVMHKMADELNLVRLQSVCFPVEKAKKFLESLGFEKEAVLRKLFQGKEDLILYSIIWRERCR